MTFVKVIIKYDEFGLKSQIIFRGYFVQEVIKFLHQYYIYIYMQKYGFKV